MAARRRSSKNKGLEENLYLNTNTGHYQYRHPVTKSFHGMGKDRAKAQVAARTLNRRLAVETESLVDKVLGNSKITFSRACDDYIKERITHNPKLAESSKQGKTYRVNRVKKDLSDRELRGFTTQDAAEWLSAFNGDSYKQHRSVLSQILNFGQTKGWVSKNVVTPTISHDVNYQKERRRLSLRTFLNIYDLAEPWFQVALDLAILTCQGRNEVATMRHSDIKDQTLFVIRKKTYQKSDTAYIAIQISNQLQQVINKSKTLPPESDFLVHRRPEKITSEQRTTDWAVKPDYLTREFRRIRDTLDEMQDIPIKARPTFHEIRSLGGHLLEEQGASTGDVQALMGHADSEMTEHYLSGHKQKWTNAFSAQFDPHSLK